MFTVMLAVVIIIIALGLAGPLKTTFDEVMAADTNRTLGLDCNNSSISDYDNAACSAIDISLPIFVGALIGIAGLIIGARILIGGSSGE